jgi:hypothetical protein
MKGIVLARLAALALAAVTVTSAASSSQPSFTINDARVSEGAAIAPTGTKSAAAPSYSKISCSVSDGTAKAGVDYVRPAPATLTIANKALTFACPKIATIGNALHDGDRTIIVTITAVRNAKIARAVGTITIVDDDPAPPPPPPATQTCPDGSVIPATSTCPLPPPPSPQWVLAPPGAARFARCKAAGGCHSENAPCPSRTGVNPPEVCTSPNIIAQPGDVREYAWGGCDAGNPCRRLANLWPLGHNPKTSGVASDWFLGVGGFEDEWEGVAPAP